jgi:alpha-beta hydrolase superfamily lysophospholipase
MKTNSVARRPVLRLVGKVVGLVLLLVIVACAGVAFAWVRVARGLPGLHGWHREAPASEFVASDAKGAYSFADYLAQEDRVFAELDALVGKRWAGESVGRFCRYKAESVCNPATLFERNWNRTFVLEAKEPVGGVLLVHGLSDAPYSLRALGERMHAAGYTVIGLRVTGNGTSPRALVDARWEDWAEAVRVGMVGLRAKVPGGRPLIMVGYSNGGALCVNYATGVIAGGAAAALPRADGLVLISPMLAITPMAEFTRLYPAIARVSGEEKMSWSGIEPEIDPFKYSSWPTNASLQAHRITRHVDADLARLSTQGKMSEYPPVLVVQSVADATVLTHGVIDALLDRLPAGRGEMILFDINRFSWLDGLTGSEFEREILPRLKRPGLAFKVVLATNREVDSREVVARQYEGGKPVDAIINAEWPAGTFSLSHVAIPIPVTDRVYGLGEVGLPPLLPLGTLSLRGERGVLTISPGLMMRMRYNPFYEWTEDRIMGWVRSLRAGA